MVSLDRSAAASPTPDSVAGTALTAYRRGLVPIPLRPNKKAPAYSDWPTASYANEDEVRATFDNHPGNLGLVLGERGGNLVDVDIDLFPALRLGDIFLPPTPMISGRASAYRSHYWYHVSDGAPSGTRQWKLPDGRVIIELRSTGGQTMIPPSTHDKTGEAYLWHGDPLGGDAGPTAVNADSIQARVAALAMVALLHDAWPSEGSRHEAYLALAGGLLFERVDDGRRVNPVWQSQLPSIIRALAETTRDEDGAEARVSEVMDSTRRRVSSSQPAVGLPRLAEILGSSAHVHRVREAALFIETCMGYVRGAPLSGPEEEAANLSSFSSFPYREREENEGAWQGGPGGPGPEPYTGLHGVVEIGEAESSSDGVVVAPESVQAVEEALHVVTDESSEGFRYRVAIAKDNLKVVRKAREEIDHEEAAEIPFPAFRPLDALLAEDIPDVDWIIEDVLPVGDKFLLSAQEKAGKTTMVVNLARSLTDGTPFLGTFPVAQDGFKVVVLDFEMTDTMLRRWYADHEIEHPERLTIVPARGAGSTFNILNEETRTKWAEMLAEVAPDVVIIDPMRPILDALGLDENHEAGRFLESVDALMREAEIPTYGVVHHMGHDGRRARGDSAILGWPAVKLDLTRLVTADDVDEDDDLADSDAEVPRLFKVSGRDVDVPRRWIEYDSESRALHYRETVKFRDLKALADGTAEVRMQEVVVEVLTAQPDLQTGSLWDAVHAAGTRVPAGKRRELLDTLEAEGIVAHRKGNGKGSPKHWSLSATYSPESIMELPKAAEPPWRR